MGASLGTQPLIAVDGIDLRKYAGKWYQVAFLPNWFQSSDAQDVIATYEYINREQLGVYNESTLAGERLWVQGTAQKDPECCRGEARFIVAFRSNPTQPFVGPPAPYWVIQLATDYRYTVVSEPSRNLLWILSRTTTISQRDIVAITNKLVDEQGFSAEQMKQLVRTKHSN